MVGRVVVGLHMVQRFEEEFGLDIQRPPLVFYTRGCFHDSARADEQCDYAISVVYEGDRAYELLYVSGEDQARPRTMTNVLRLSGTLAVLAVGVSRPYTSVAADFNTEFADAQNTINRYHDDYAASIGRSEPILQFHNTNVVIRADDLTGVDPRNPAAVQARLTDLGHAPDSYDIVMLFNLDPRMQDNASAFRDSRYIRVGWYLYERTGSVDITPDEWLMIANTAYGHEVTHLSGWPGGFPGVAGHAHYWPSGDPSIGVWTHPVLLGWTDTDGDGEVDLLDSTPYGR